MRASPLAPAAHVFVCGNRREPDAPLGPGCAERGDAVYDAFKHAVARRGLVARVWVTKTHCLGLCPPRGCTVALYPRRAFFIDVAPTDVDALLDQAVSAP
jgi:(2Fe-2S) ferredoxin